MSSEADLEKLFLEKDEEKPGEKNKEKFDFEGYIFKNKTPFLIALLGLILLGLGIFFLKSNQTFSSGKIEVLEDATQSQDQSLEVVTEIAGAVEKPGVYKLYSNARVEDLIISAGGLSVDADRIWVEKYINKAARLIDGQKIIVQRVSQQSIDLPANNNDVNKLYQEVMGSNSRGLININTATLKELDSLSGIGPVYGQNIIEGRPYSSVEDLLSRGILKKNTFEKIKDKITVY